MSQGQGLGQVGSGGRSRDGGGSVDGGQGQGQGQGLCGVQGSPLGPGTGKINSSFSSSSCTDGSGVRSHLGGHTPGDLTPSGIDVNGQLMCESEIEQAMFSNESVVSALLSNSEKGV